MVTDITRDTLNLIVNDTFRKDAELYVRIYEDFLENVRSSGMDTAGRLYSLGIMSEDRLKDVSGIESGNAGHSLFYGEISPACIHCRTGVGSKTVFQTLKCNRDCYFCANMNQQDYDYFVENVNDALAELSENDSGDGFRSIALTGGEPLLMPEKVLEFFAECRRRYPDAYLRLYSNGDFLTDELSKELADAGLDEIRISVKADGGGYPSETVEAVRTAARHIKNPMVEMPVIPGSLDVMMHLLRELDKAGCKGINILEFLYPFVNNEKFRSRGFQVKDRPYKVLYDYGYAGGLPVEGSEEECIELLRFAAEEGLKMSVHYCSLENKLTAQIFSQNSGIKLMPYEMRSEKDHFIKTARAYGSNATKVVKFMKKNGMNSFHAEAGGLKVEFHPQYISEISGLTEAALTYNVVESDGEFKSLREVKVDLINPAEFDFASDV